MIRVFVSSVQKEFAKERRALKRHIEGDALPAEPLYLTKHIERMGTGIRDMIAHCRNAGLPEPEFRLDPGFFILTIRRKTAQVTGQVAAQVIKACEMPKKLTELQELVGIRHRGTFLNNYLRPLLASGWIELTIPEKPRSSKQQYRISEKGLAVLRQLEL